MCNPAMNAKVAARKTKEVVRTAKRVKDEQLLIGIHNAEGGTTSTTGLYIDWEFCSEYTALMAIVDRIEYLVNEDKSNPVLSIALSELASTAETLRQ